MKKERIFKYYPEDFGALNVKVIHMDLKFDMFDDHTKVESEIKMQALDDIDHIDLNAKNLEILDVQYSLGKCESDYKKEENILRIVFEKTIKKEAFFKVKTKSICRPSHHILEGLYYDETPPNCPCQQITQCQQWGFQRIVPCIDDMTAKCTYKTRIVADSRYTNLISNGDISEKRQLFKKDRDTIKYDNIITPMATYLFFLGAGTYKTFKREFEYPNGDKFMLELLVPPHSDTDVANKALSVLHDAILWVYLFTGPDKYKNYKQSLKIKKLVDLREKLKEGKNKEKLNKIREELANMIRGIKFGYKYTGTVYREIGMQNSDFGGMENVGNTTITTNRIMPFPEMSDGSFEYMVRVKVHEFYHNLNGSEVTGRSPFEIWLNEAVTVFIEQEYHEFLFGEEYCRLDTVLDLLYPGNGTLAMDENLASMPIEPDGFNDPNELITGVTYVKAPEFVRMIETLMGKEKFVEGLHLYHSRFKHGNASRAQWVECMEEASGMNFTKMAHNWLKQSAYPKVYVKSSYKNGNFILDIEQKGVKPGMHWEFPFVVALVDKNGKDISGKIYRIKEVKEKIVFQNVKKPAFVSLNREYSFYGKVFYECSDQELYLQARKDPDVINRYMAFHKLADKEKAAILSKNSKVSKSFIDLYFEFLNDENLMLKVGASILTLFESVENEKFAHKYQDLYEAKKKIKKAIAERYKKELISLYKKYAGLKFQGSYVEKKSKEIKARSIKNTCLSLLAELDTNEIHTLIKKQFEKAKCATDKIAAFGLYINSHAKDKNMLIQKYQKEAQKSLVSWEAFLATIARNDSDDFMEIIEEIEKSPIFRIEQTNEQRAFYGAFASNRKKSLLTEKGRNFLKDRIKKLALINEYSTLHMLKVFGDINKIEKKYQRFLIQDLNEIKDFLDEKKTPSVFNTIGRILKLID